MTGWWRGGRRDAVIGVVVMSMVTSAATTLDTWRAAPATAADPPVEVTTTITSPADGDEVDDGVVIEADAVAGVAAGGQRALVLVLDLSGSVNNPAGGDCDGNGSNDSILRCEIEAALEVVDRAITLGGVDEVGVAVFAGSGTAADVSPETGFQYLTEPDADLNGNGVLDLEEVIRSVYVNGGVRQFTARGAGAGTNYAAGIGAACAVAAQATDDPLVVFLSDGDNLLGGNVAGQLPCSNPAEFQTFAVGTGASCSGDPTGRGSLDDVADLTGGACTNVVAPTDLPRILSETLTPDITSVTASVNGGAPIDLAAYVTPALPAPSLSLAWPALGLAPGVNEICITSTVDSDGQVGSATDCIEVFARGGIAADAGPDQDVPEGSVVTLDATESTGSGLLTTTWTTTDEFASGTSINVDDADDRLALDDEQQAFEVIWVAASARGTVVKIDTRTGEVLGEYWSAPQNRAKDPSRTTVDKTGSVWLGNRAEASSVGGSGKGSVTKIGLAENGQCVDRNGDGVIQTSTGLGDIRPWPNASGEDNAGGTTTAADECIVEYVRTNGINIRHVSVDPDNHVWVGGGYGAGAIRMLDRVTPTGEIVRTIDMRNPAHTGESGAIECCYGGLIDGDGVIWTATAHWNRLVRIDPSVPNGSPDLVRVIALGRIAYGLGIDPDGNIWVSNWTQGTIQKVQPDGTLVGTFSTGGPGGDRGVAATADGDIWVANSAGASVSRLRNDGTFVAEIAVGVQPTGIAVDAAGKVWATNLSSSTASRIDPATNTADLTVALGAGASPYNYSDMTGSTLTGAADQGTWSVIHDSGSPGTPWALVDWTADVPGDGSVTVSIATSDDGVTFGPETAVEDGLRLADVNGQYARVTVRLVRASTGTSPSVYDVAVASPGEAGPLSYEWRLVESTGPAVFLSSASSATPSFVAPDDGVYTFELTVADGAGQTDTDRVTITVGNLDPALAVEIGDSFAGGVTQVTASFTDPGWLDLHGAEIDWGDGTHQAIVVTAQGTGWGTFFGSHVYQAAGSYTASITVTDDDGGSSTQTLGQVAVAEPVALWANSTLAPRTINWSGAGGSIDGTVHTNNELRFVGSTKTVIGPTTYAGALSADTDRHIFEPNPVTSPVLERPFDVDVAEFRPGGSVQLAAGAAYHDMSAACAAGVWHEPQAVLPPGVYYVPCDVQLNGSDIGGEITLVAEGTIRISGERPAFEPYLDGLLFVSGSSDPRSIDIAAASSKFLGIVFSDAGGIEISGSDNSFYCGILGDTIALTGGDLTIRGATCGEPDATVAGPLLVPDLALSLAADREFAGPTETIGYDLVATNTGGRVVIPGLLGVENVDTSTATITGFSLGFERFDVATSTWVAFPADPTALTVDLRHNDYPGVTYGPDGPIGTSLAPGGFATWGYQAVVELDTAAIDALLDPEVTGGVRSVAEFDRDPATVQLRSLYRYGSDFVEALRALGSNIDDVSLTVLLPEGDPVTLNATTHPGLAALVPGAVVSATTSFEVPTPAARSPFETDAGYLARLAHIDGTVLTAAAFALAEGGVGRLVAPLASAGTTRRIPVVSTRVEGPDTAEAGATVDYDVPVANVGSAEAATVVVADVDGTTLTLEGAPASLSAGQIVTAGTSYTPDADLAGPVALRAESTWTDARGVTYGPLGTTVGVDVLAPGDLAATLIDTLVVDANRDGYVSPGDTLRYTATVTNRGGALLTGAHADITPDPRSGIVAGSVTTDVGTVATGNTAGDSTVVVTIGDLAGGATATLTFDVVVADPFPAGIQRLEVHGSAAADGVDPVAMDDPARPGAGDPTRTPIVVPIADVYASLEVGLAVDRDGNGIPSSGDRLTATIEATSTGSLPVDDLVVTVPIPAPATLVAGSVTTSAGTVIEGDSVHVDVGGLAAFGDDPVVITFDLDIDDNLTSDTTLTLQGTLAAPGLGERVTDDQPTPAADDATVVAIAKIFSGGGGGGGGTGGGGGSGIPGPTLGAVSVEEGELVATPTEITTVLTPPLMTMVTGWSIGYRRTGTDDVTTLAASGPMMSPEPVDVSATFDPTVLPNGSYEIVVTAESSDGGITVSTLNVVVDGDFKPGRFTLAYEDLSVQFPGMPVRVIRSYDSFDTSTGDFGRGWSLDATRVGIATTANLADGWDANLRGCALIICYYSVTSEIDKQVYVTWPDGKVDTFTIRVNDFNGLFPGITSMYLEAADDNRAEAELLDNSAYYVNGSLQSGLFGIDGDITIDTLRLKVIGGATYLVSKSGGLLSATSPGGEMLTYTDAGVTSNVAGQVVRYVRDGQGRITELIGPNGATTTYTYNALGELVQVDGPGGESASFTYHPDHTLNEALDGSGTPIRRVEYDADGRVTAITDGNGNRVVIDADVDGRQQIITDAAGGYTSITTYDERGNPVQIDEVYDGATETTTLEWNEQNLPTTRTDPLGQVWITDYDANGDAVRFVDPDGNEVTYTYARRGLPATVTDQEGHVTRFTYDDRGQPLTITDPLGEVEHFAYDAAGRLIRRTDRGGVEASWTYDANGRIRTMTQGGPDDPVTNTITWDALGNPRTVTEPNGAITEVVYDAAGRLTEIVDPLGERTVITYDDAGRVATQTPPDGNTTTYVYDTGGRLDSASDVLGNTTMYEYDANDRLLAITEPSGATTTYGRDDAGRVVSITDDLGATTTFDLDPLGRIEAVTDPLGRTTSLVYDSFGRLTSTTTESGATWEYGYDGRGLLVESEDPLGHVEQRDYDALGQLILMTDRRGFDTTYAYDEAGQLDRLTDALGGVVDFDYDSFGNVASVTDPIGVERSFTYDAAGNLLTATSPAQGTTTYTYDLAGRPETITDARGITVTTGFDPVGRLTTVDTPEGLISYDYDAIGRPTSMTDLVGTTTWTYDPGAPERVISVASPQGTVSYGYDEVGRRTSMTQPEGTVTYGYDPAGQLTSLTDWTGATSTFGYDLDGLLDSIERPNGVTTEFDYDAALRLVGITHAGGGSPIEAFDYTLDANGNRVAVASSAGNESYDLDELGRLRTVTYPGGEVVGYTYDAAGNRLTRTAGGTTTTYTYDTAGRLTSDGTDAFTYDAVGNVTSHGTTTYEWDWAGQMTSATVDGSETTYEYAGDGTRVAAVDSTGTTEFLWDRETGLPILVSDGDAGYLQLGRAPFASTADGGGTAAYSLTDALGSVRAVTGPTGQVAATQSFDVWGAPRAGVSTTFGFAGEQHDPTGLIHLRARQYDPTLGRFLSADAVQPNAAGTQGWNLYGYAAANPSTLIDPSGNFSLIGYTATAAIGGALVGAILGGAMGLLQCTGSGTDYALCVLRQAGIGAISGLVAGIVFALAYAALAVMGAGWATAAGLAGAASGAAGAGVGGAFNGGPSLTDILAGAFLGAFAGVVGGWFSRTPAGQALTRYIDDLLARMRSSGGGSQSGSALANAGRAAEDLVSTRIGLPRNAGPGRTTVPGTGSGGYRVPDFNPYGPQGTIATRGTVVEVKDVAQLSSSAQLRDLVAFAQSQGVPLEIFTNARIPATGQLARWIQNGDVIISPL